MKQDGRRVDQRLLVWFFAFMVFSLVFIHQQRFNFGTPNSRLDLLHAIVVHRTLRIDAYQANTDDKALYEGHFYSPKAPGIASLALPAFAAASGLLHLCKIALDSETGWLVTSWAACVVSQALPAALGAVALWLWLVNFVGQRVALCTVLALFLGGMPLPYSTVLFSHAEVVGLLCITIWAIQVLVPVQHHTLASGEDTSVHARLCPPAVRGIPSLSCIRPVLAGFCAGFALASEYTSGIVIMAIGVYVACRRRPHFFRFVLGAISPLLLIPVYSWATVGSPFRMPYGYAAVFQEMHEGFYSIKLPNATTAFNFLFSPERGLFFWSPFLVMVAFGYRELMRRASAGFWFTYAVPLLQIVVISGRAWDWQAGWVFGARYLSPILPLLALPCALGLERWRRLGLALALYSIGLVTAVTLTDACLPYELGNPFTQWILPHLYQGSFSYTLGTSVFGMSRYLSAGLYCAILVGGFAWLWHLMSICGAVSQNGTNHAPERRADPSTDQSFAVAVNGIPPDEPHDLEPLT